MTNGGTHHTSKLKKPKPKPQKEGSLKGKSKKWVPPVLMKGK